MNHRQNATAKELGRKTHHHQADIVVSLSFALNIGTYVNLHCSIVHKAVFPKDKNTAANFFTYVHIANMIVHINQGPFSQRIKHGICTKLIRNIHPAQHEPKAKMKQPKN